MTVTVAIYPDTGTALIAAVEKRVQFLLVEPTVDPDDLSSAIARNWWPALEEGRMTAFVAAGGTVTVPRPMKDPRSA